MSQAIIALSQRLRLGRIKLRCSLQIYLTYAEVTGSLMVKSSRPATHDTHVIIIINVVLA